MSAEQQEGLTPSRPGFARRFSGYFLERWSSLQIVSDIDPREQAVDRENRSIDESQKAHFSANLLHPPESVDEKSILRLNAIKGVFETELNETHSMADRFELFTQPFYKPYVRSLDLGETKNPGSHDEVVALKEEYHELLAALIERNIVQGELPRSKAKPRIHLSLTSGSEYVSATRNRDLFSIEEDARTLYVAKRMSFLMPSSTANQLNVTRGGSLAVNEIKRVEGWLDAQDPEAIVPVRTVYYVRSKLKKSEE